MKSRNVARNDFRGWGRDLVLMKLTDARKIVQAFLGKDSGGYIFYVDV